MDQLSERITDNWRSDLLSLAKTATLCDSKQEVYEGDVVGAMHQWSERTKDNWRGDLFVLYKTATPCDSNVRSLGQLSSKRIEEN